MARSPDLARLVMFGRRPDAGRPAATMLTGPQSEPGPAAAGLAAGSLATTESMATGQGTSGGGQLADFDARLIKESFAYVMASPQQSMEYFFAHLFSRNPEIRTLFPLEMSGLRDRVFSALARLVWSMDEPESSAAFLVQIGRDHRKFGVRDRHLQSFFAALADTVERAAGLAWTPAMATAWQHVLHNANHTMRTAMQQDGQVRPAWWLAEIVRHELRTDSLAVLTLRPDQPYSYQPGQFIDVQVPRWPRLWRSYSPGNAPRPDGTIDLHVRAVPGGLVSNALVHHMDAGENVLLGPPRGTMTAASMTAAGPATIGRTIGTEPGTTGTAAAGYGPAGHPAPPAVPPCSPSLACVQREVLCVAGGTGLAPIKAIIEGLVGSARPGLRPAVTLLFCARSEDELYDLAALRELEASCPGLSVIPAVISRPGTLEPGRTLPDLMAGRTVSADSEVFISGPAAMVMAASRALGGRVAAERIHHDPLDGIPLPPPSR